jgi:hypothetical protein
MGQNRSTCIPHLVVLITTGNNSVFRRECNTGTSRRSLIRRLSSHEVVTGSSYLNTHGHILLKEGANMTEKSLSLCQYYCQEVLTMHGGGGLLEREDREKGQTLAFWVLLLTGSMILGFFASRVPKKFCLPFGFWHPGLVRRKKPSPPEPPVVACSPPFLNARASSHRDFMQMDILDRRPDNRQATGLRGEHVDLISALAHIDLRDSQWHSSSECAGGCAAETHKTSTSALHPLSGCAPLPR